LEQVALAVDRERRKELPGQILFLVRLLLLVVVAEVVMDRAYKMARMAALEVVVVGITMCKLLLDRATLQAQLLLKATMVEMLRRFKTTVVAVVALVQ
jgi:hypothetical protein